MPKPNVSLPILDTSMRDAASLWVYMVCMLLGRELNGLHDFCAFGTSPTLHDVLNNLRLPLAAFLADIKICPCCVLNNVVNFLTCNTNLHFSQVVNV